MIDLQMPTGSGMAAVQKMLAVHLKMVKSNPDLPDPVLIAKSAHRNQDSSKLAFADGFKGIIYKPVEVQNLKECLIKHLDKEVFNRLKIH